MEILVIIFGGATNLLLTLILLRLLDMQQSIIAVAVILRRNCDRICAKIGADDLDQFP